MAFSTGQTCSLFEQESPLELQSKEDHKMINGPATLASLIKQRFFFRQNNCLLSIPHNHVYADHGRLPIFFEGLISRLRCVVAVGTPSRWNRRVKYRVTLEYTGVDWEENRKFLSLTIVRLSMGGNERGFYRRQSSTA
jgi:hypothetical protein